MIYCYVDKKKSPNIVLSCINVKLLRNKTFDRKDSRLKRSKLFEKDHFKKKCLVVACVVSLY